MMKLEQALNRDVYSAEERIKSVANGDSVLWNFSVYHPAYEIPHANRTSKPVSETSAAAG